MLICVIAFLLPFNFVISILIGLALAGFVFFGNQKEGFTRLFSAKWTYFFLSFFFLHVIAYFFSENKREAMSAIEIKLSFLVFPLLLFTQEINRTSLRTIGRCFALGVLSVSLINIGRAFYYFLIEHDSSHLFYSSFSFFMHPSYFAMLAVFSIILISFYGLDFFNSKIKNKVLTIVISFVLGVAVFMSASKMGLLSLFITLPILLFYVLVKQKRYKLLVGIAFTLIVGIILVMQFNFAPVQRLRNAFNFVSSQQLIDKTTTESNAVRVLIWKQAINIIKQKPVLGVTPGDANEALYKAYEKEGMTGALEIHLNAHNQYLQSLIGTGFVGGFLLIIITFGLLVVGIVRKNILLLLFGLLITLNFVVESMLQTQAGTLFFVFFACLLLTVELSEKSDKSKMKI
jgi:O-antigen ligase